MSYLIFSPLSVLFLILFNIKFLRLLFLLEHCVQLAFGSFYHHIFCFVLFLLLCLCSLQFDFNASLNKSPVRNILAICLRPLFHSFVHLYNFSKEIAYTFGFVVLFCFSLLFADPTNEKSHRIHTVGVV